MMIMWLAHYNAHITYYKSMVIKFTFAEKHVC